MYILFHSSTEFTQVEKQFNLIDNYNYRNFRVATAKNLLHIDLSCTTIYVTMVILADCIYWYHTCPERGIAFLFSNRFNYFF